MTIQQAIEKGYFPQVYPIDKHTWKVRIIEMNHVDKHPLTYEEEFARYQDALDFGLLTIEEL